jgi:hypothetical protein
MAVRSKFGRRLRWLVLLGLVGTGAWAFRARQAGRAGLLETWPTPVPASSSSAGTSAVAPVRAVPGPPDEPTSDVVTPPLGIAKPVVVTPLASPPPEVETPAAADVAADTDSRLVPDPAPEAPDGADAADPGSTPATQPGPSGQALFSPPGVNGTSPAEPAATRPSPTPRPRPAASEAESRYGLGSAAPLPDGSAPGPEYTIKGNAGSMLFHRPDSPYYARTKAQVWFRTATDARAAGFTEWVPRSRTSS